jgi:glutathione synthase/RimK-type ligase-like ATP-grasp enzyme
MNESHTRKIFLEVCKQRGWRVDPIPLHGLIITTSSGQTFITHGTNSELNSSVGASLSKNKYNTITAIRKLGIACDELLILDTDSVDYMKAGMSYIQTYGPIVVKPNSGQQGNGVSVNISDQTNLAAAITRASKYAKRVILQPYYSGNDYRILVVGGKIAGVAHRIPATVTGNGISTISELIDSYNSTDSRGDDHGSALMKVNIDDVINHLGPGALTQVPSAGQAVVLTGTSNLSTGGSIIDRTNDISGGFQSIALKIADALGLYVCGIDVIAEDIARDPDDQKWGFLEANPMPGLRSAVDPKSVVEDILDEIVRRRTS